MPRLQRWCQVCHQKVRPSMSGMVAAHWDSIGRPCRGDELSYETAIVGDSPRPERSAS